MPKRESRGRQGPRRTAHHREPVDAEMIEQVCEGISLIGERWISRKIAMQITEARGRYNFMLALPKRRCEVQPLIETTPGTVNHQQWCARTGHRIFEGSEWCRYSRALSGNTLFRSSECVLETRPRISPTEHSNGPSTEHPLPPRCLDHRRASLPTNTGRRAAIIWADRPSKPAGVDNPAHCSASERANSVAPRTVSNKSSNARNHTTIVQRIADVRCTCQCKTTRRQTKKAAASIIGTSALVAAS